MTSSVTAAIDDALRDEALRAREACQHVAPVARCVYDGGGESWLCECGQVGCGRTWLVRRHPDHSPED